jgi:hypothetical protein
VRGLRGRKIRGVPDNLRGVYSVLKRVTKWQGNEMEAKTAVEATENTRYFKNWLEATGIEVTVINMLKMKVMNESVKKQT